jgi:hypothetical protein
MTPLIVNGVSIYISPDFGSDSPDYRLRLRRALQENIRDQILKKKNPDVENHDPASDLVKNGTNRFINRFNDRWMDDRSLRSLNDLSMPPRLDGWSISVSHCAGVGGFHASESQIHVGLDFEIASRVTPAIARRVAAFKSEEKILAEIETARLPPVIFWAAKEAGIKAFGNRDPLFSPHFGNIEIVAIDVDNGSFTAAHLSTRASGNFFALNRDLAEMLAFGPRSEIIGAFAKVEALAKS